MLVLFLGCMFVTAAAGCYTFPRNCKEIVKKYTCSGMYGVKPDNYLDFRVSIIDFLALKKMFYMHVHVYLCRFTVTRKLMVGAGQLSRGG